MACRPWHRPCCATDTHSHVRIHIYNRTAHSRLRPRPHPHPQAPPANNSMLVVNNATPILWVAPVSYSVQTWRYGNDSGSTLLFSVRGDKYGAACPLR